jgi:hypothetical protein
VIVVVLYLRVKDCRRIVFLDAVSHQHEPNLCMLNGSWLLLRLWDVGWLATYIRRALYFAGAVCLSEMAPIVVRRGFNFPQRANHTPHSFADVPREVFDDDSFRKNRHDVSRWGVSYFSRSGRVQRMEGEVCSG